MRIYWVGSGFTAKITLEFDQLNLCLKSFEAWFNS
jgi:hypothetical protein